MFFLEPQITQIFQIGVNNLENLHNLWFHKTIT